MKPTEILSQEHRVIEQVLDCLEAMADKCASGGQFEAQPARDAVAFLRNFADRCHHGKEEAHLFPAMEARGFPREGGPTGVMLYEHEQGRACVRGMAEAIEAAATGDAEAAASFVEHARRYGALLRAHIEKEDHCLFPMADGAFTAEDQQALLDAFARVEKEEMGEGTHEDFVRIADELARRYGVSPAASAEAKLRGCSCSH